MGSFKKTTVSSDFVLNLSPSDCKTSLSIISQKIYPPTEVGVDSSISGRKFKQLDFPRV